jgi:ferrochelatase
MKKTVFFSVFLFVLLAGFSLSADNNKKIGVLFSSYGDVDHPSELKDLVINTVSDPDVLSLPWWLSGIIAQIAWYQGQDGVWDEYEAIGGKSNYRENSWKQANLVASLLQEEGYDVTPYVGFTKTFPYVEEALHNARKDGIEELVVYYQGAQYAHTTAYITFRDVKKYLKKYPEWDVKVTAVRSFFADDEFNNLIVNDIKKRISIDIPDVPAEDICIFLPAHGQIMKWINQGDPYLDQLLYNIDYIKEAFPENPVHFGFQNHDEFPFVKWTEPTFEKAITDMADESCSHVIVNGKLSFTVDSLETLFDHQVEIKHLLEESGKEFGIERTVYAEPMFNDDPDFAEYLKGLTIDAAHKPDKRTFVPAS